MKFKLLSILLFFNTFCFSQNEQLDSLLTLLKNSEKQKEKIDILNNIALLSINIDLDSSRKYARQALHAADKENYTEGKALACSIMGKISAYTQSADTALHYLNESLRLYKKLNDKPKQAIQLNRIGLVYYLHTQYEVALEFFLKALKHTESQKERVSILNNLGLLYLDLKKEAEALVFIKEALNLSRQIKDKKNEGIATANLAECFVIKKEYDKAFDFFRHALIIFSELNQKEKVAQTYYLIAKTYLEINKPQRCINNAGIAIEIFSELKKERNLSFVYCVTGKAFIKLSNYHEAKKNLEKGLVIANKYKDTEIKKNIYLVQSKLNSALGNFGAAYTKLSKYNTLKDSLYSIQKARMISEMQTKYKLKQKEDENRLLLEKEQLSDEKYKLQRLINIVLVVLFILLVGLILKTVQGNKKMKRINSILEQKNAIIYSKNEELESQKEEIETQKNDLHQQNKRLVEHEKLTTASIKYALKIQMAVLPDRMQMDEIFSNYFIFFKPLQIVSGDFYWLKKVGDKEIIAVGDCTGHGVPGAFLSMLGISLLQETVNKNESLKPSDILNRLRKNMKGALKQGHRDIKKSEDGLDIALCVIDKKQNELQFAGAYRPLYIVCENNKQQFSGLTENKRCIIETGNAGTLIEIKPDRQPISAFYKETPFTNHCLNYSETDTFYLFSDGYYDQFNDERNEKFTTKRFKKLLLSVKGMTMTGQKKMLKKSFYAWLENSRQTDDVLVAGFKIPDET